MGVLKKVYEKFSSMTGERVHDENGYELPDPTPIAPPIGYKEGPTIREQMRAMIALASHEASQAGYETLEEAEDFDTGEDDEPVSQYELDSDLPSIAELNRRKDEEVARRQAPSPKPKKNPVAPDQGASAIDPAQPGDQSAEGA